MCPESVHWFAILLRVRPPGSSRTLAVDRAVGDHHLVRGRLRLAMRQSRGLVDVAQWVLLDLGQIPVRNCVEAGWRRGCGTWLAVDGSAENRELLTQRHKEHKEKQTIEWVGQIAARVCGSTCRSR